MAEGSLDRWVRFMAAMARPGGTAAVIHKAEALAALLAACDGRFGALEVLPMHPRRDAAAIRVLVQGIKGSRAPLQLLPAAHRCTATTTASAPRSSAILRRRSGAAQM